LKVEINYPAANRAAYGFAMAGSTIKPSFMMLEDSTTVSRKSLTKNKKGDKIGGDFNVPDGNFSRFLGYKKQQQGEKRGKMSGGRVLELAVQKAFDKLGPKASANGSRYRNMYISMGARKNSGRSGDSVKELQDSVQSAFELNKSSNMAYLEMQYKFQNNSRSFSVISNLMKTRNESTKKSISEIR